ncbi:MAG TPA: DUF1015 family protein [Nocardioides sp.]|jgi:uncharacterized protein (DUF1015 family)|nr:DUF1015 family protein [Nocardioides sp.]
MEPGPPTVPPYVAGPLQLTPFRALSLGPRNVGDPASARAFARPYRGVPQRLEAWRTRGLATLDDEPAIYLHEYSDSGLTVRGLVGCLDVSHRTTVAREQQVFPHEGVHPRQVADLAHRMATMRINPAPILLVHHGPVEIREVSGRVRAGRPEREYVDHAGQEHRIWRVTGPAELESIASGLAGARLLVADGHHRYAAYIALHDREPTPAHRGGLAMVVDQDETPLFLGAIHRLLHGTKLSQLVRAATEGGADVRTVDHGDAGAEAVAALAPDTLVLADGRRWATVQLEVPTGTAMVQLVDDVLLARLPRPPTRVTFAHSVSQALDQVRPDRVAAALLPAVDLDLVLETVGAGGLLPEKATSFQPKPSLGSFIRLLDG